MSKIEVGEKQIKELQRVVRKHEKDMYGISGKLWRNQIKDQARREVIVGRAQERLYKKLSKASKSDLEVMERQHMLDNAAGLELRKKNRKMLKEHAREQNKAFRTRLRAVRKMKDRFEWNRPNPGRAVCNWFASAITWEEAGNAPGSFPSTGLGGAGRNIFKAYVNADSGANTVNATLIVHHDFFWMSDRAGTASVLGWLNLTGWWDLSSVGSCWFRSSAGIRIRARLSVFQPGGAVLSGPEVTILDNQRSTQCVNIVTSGVPAPVDTGEVEVTRENYPLIAGQPVIASVLLTIELSASNHGEATLNIAAPGRYNVPSVWILC